MVSWTKDEIKNLFGDILGTHEGDVPAHSKRQRIKDAAAEALLKQVMGVGQRFMLSGDPNSPKERKKRRILQAATQLFIQQGYRKTSIDEVAQDAGVAKGTVYLYFKNKSDLLIHAIAAEKMLYLGDVLAILRSRGDHREKLRRYLEAGFLMVTRMPLVSKLMTGDRELLGAMEDYSADMNIDITDLQVRFLTFMVRRAASNELTKSQIDERARVLVGLFYTSGFMADERLRSGLSVEQYAAVLADILVDGITNPKSGDERGEL